MSLLIQKEGIFTSIQGLGPFGLQRYGVNPRGAMDTTAVRIINLLLGNDEGAPVLECHFPGPEIIFEQYQTFALGGADLAAELDGESLTNWKPHVAPGSSTLRFRRQASGNRCYLAIPGGVKMASKAPTNEFSTAPLIRGERLTSLSPAAPKLPRLPAASTTILPAYSRFPIVRVIAGPEFSRLSNEQASLIETSGFTITKEANRMGFRLNGPALIPDDRTELVSAAVTFGTIQLFPDGQLVILMAEHPTSGGYPRLAHVISADLPLAAQLGTGDKLAFKLIDIAEAERIASRLETDLNKLRIGLSFGRYW
ncbi:MAG: biotin-dependent carboxyltransferase family protein [Pyrinomonadaceae bacterium]